MIVNNFDLKLLYRSGGSEKIVEMKVDALNAATQNDDVTLGYEVIENENYDIITVRVNPKIAINLDKFYIGKESTYNAEDRIFCNGYQSWTDTRELMINEKMPPLQPLAKFIEPFASYKPVSDYSFVDYSKKTGDFHSFTYSYIANGGNFLFFGSLEERSGYTVIKHRTQARTMTIEKLVDGIRVSEEYQLLKLMIMKSDNYDKVFDTYFKEMKIKKPKKQFANGYTTWYNHYQNVNADIVYDNINAFKQGGYKIDIFQIDDGYQTAIGDWLDVDKTKFLEGMKVIADFIKAKNMTPGLWLAPFACTKASNIYKNHKDWLVLDERGKPIKAGSNWGGFYTLDFYKPAAREYIINVFDVVLNQWGYELVKLDFLYQACSVLRENKTRGQIMCEAMDFLRECVGEKLILGCGVPLAPSFGKVDFCRIGCDISLDWNGPSYATCHRERISTKNAIMNSIYRRHLDGRAFVNDTDVFLLRENNIKMNSEQKELLACVNNITGNLLFTSDNVKTYNENQKKLFLQSYLKRGISIKSVTNEAPFIVSMQCEQGGKEFSLKIDANEGKFI